MIKHHLQYQYNNITLSLIQVLNNQGLGLECLTFSTIFQSYWWRKPKYPGKTTDLPQVTDKHLSHNLVSSTPCLSGIQTHKVSGEYYHTITTTTTPKHSIYIYSKTPLYLPSIHRQEFLQSRFPYVVITPLKCQTRIPPSATAIEDQTVNLLLFKP